MTMKTLIDSNILIDIATNDSQFADWSVNELLKAGEFGELFVNQIVVVETYQAFRNKDGLDHYLASGGIIKKSIPWECCARAAEAFENYKKRRRASGSSVQQQAPRILADFLIGAHAEYCAMRLLTRDAKRFSQDFSNVELITPN